MKVRLSSSRASVPDMTATLPLHRVGWNGLICSIFVNLANDGFHEAAGLGQLPDNARKPGIGHVRAQQGLQVHPGEGEFAGGGGDRPAGDDALDRDHQMEMKSIIKLLLFCGAIAIVCFSGKHPAAWGAGEDTKR